MTAVSAVVIAVGNEFREDDGVGPAVIAELELLQPPGVRLVITDGEPTQLFDAWAGMPLAIVIDAVLCEPSTPGRVHRTTLSGPLRASAIASTHGLGIPEAVRLAEALDLAPHRLVVFAVEAERIGFGTGLSGPVARAVPEVVRAVMAEISTAPGRGHRAVPALPARPIR